MDQGACSTTAVKWLKYCRYGVNTIQSINESNNKPYITPLKKLLDNVKRIREVSTTLEANRHESIRMGNTKRNAGGGSPLKKACQADQMTKFRELKHLRSVYFALDRDNTVRKTRPT